MKSLSSLFGFSLGFAHMFGLAVVLACMSACGGGGGGAPEALATLQTSVGTAPALVAAAPPSADANSITLRAAAAGFGNGAAILQIRLNDKIVGSVEIRSRELSSHRIEGSFQGHDGPLELVWLLAQGGPGRSITVESVTVGNLTLSPLDNDVVFDQGDGPAAFDGVDLVPGQRTLTMAGALRFVLPMVGRSTAAATLSGLEVPGVDLGYYVDAAQGNDSHPGTIDKPWRSLARLTAVRLKAGQGIYLRCGSTWRESLALGAVQLVDGSTIAGYGSECGTRKAVISGADDFSGGWQKSGNLWSRSLPAGTAKITQLFVAGQVLRTAQWPNAEPAPGSSRMALAASSSASTKIAALRSSDSALLKGKELVGATVQARTQPWFVETRRVLSDGNGMMNFDNSTDWALDVGEGLVLQDKRWMLDAPGEFFHDTAAQRLYVIAPDAGMPADLNTASVEGSVRDVAIALTQRSNLVVRDLALRAAREDGLRITDAPQVILERIEARENKMAGVRLWQWEKTTAARSGPSITDSLVAGNGQYGIDAWHVSGAQIKRNRVLATGTAAHHQAGVFASIAAGPGAAIEDNVVDGSGYIGIRFSTLAGSVVARNTISGYCRRLSDCGGIYTWTGRAAATAANAATQLATVEGNRVMAAAAQLEGAVADGREVVAGIYIDDFSRNVTVRNNQLAGMPMGIFLHNASQVIVEANHIWLPTTVALWASMDQLDADWARGNVLRNNHIVPLVQADTATGPVPSFTTAQAIWFWHFLDGESALAAERNSFTGNVVTQLQGPLAAHAWLRGPRGERYVNTVEWQAINPADLPPLRPARFVPIAATLGPELVVSGSFNSGIAPWRTHQNPAGRGFAIQPLASVPTCSATCMGFTAGHPFDLLASEPFTLRTGIPHVYRWTAVMPASAAALVGPPFVGREASPWDVMADGRGFVGYGPRQGAAGEKLQYETHFVPKSSDPARVNLQIETAGVQVAFNAVSVREVIAYSAAKASDWSALAFAPTDTARTLGCAELGWPAGCRAIGLNGEPLALPLTLPAGTMLPLFRADSPYRR